MRTLESRKVAHALSLSLSLPRGEGDWADIVLDEILLAAAACRLACSLSPPRALTPLLPVRPSVAAAAAAVATVIEANGSGAINCIVGVSSLSGRRQGGHLATLIPLPRHPLGAKGGKNNALRRQKTEPMR